MWLVEPSMTIREVSKWLVALQWAIAPPQSLYSGKMHILIGCIVCGWYGVMACDGDWPRVTSALGCGVTSAPSLALAPCRCVALTSKSLDCERLC